MTAAELDRTGGAVLASEVFPADLTSLAAVRAFVERWAHEIDLSAEKAFRIKVAVSEACANAIEHPGESSAITLWAWHREGRFVIDVWQAGEFQVRMRQDQGHRGMGLPLMVACADEVVFAALPEGGTRVSLAVFVV